MFKELLKKTPLYSFWKEYREIRGYWRWLKDGRPVPPPHGIKQGIIKEYARNYHCQIFFETGSYQGDMIQAVKKNFKQIYSVELSETFYQNVKQRFKHDHHITLLQGDSGEVVRDSLNHIHEPCLFWLDAHYSGGNTAKGEKLSPIMEEIIPILNHTIKSHVILIDDAREFAGKDGYPDLVELKQKVIRRRPDLSVMVELDIIRICENGKGKA